MPGEDKVEKDEVNGPSRPPRDLSQQRSFAAAFAQWSAIVTGLAAVIYVLGVVALLMPVARLYTQDFSTAMYAASLVPKTVVIGQGVRSLFSLPLFVSLFVLLGNLLPAVVTEIYLKIFKREPGKLRWLIVLLVGIALILTSGPVVIALGITNWYRLWHSSEPLVRPLFAATLVIYVSGMIILTVIIRLREGRWSGDMIPYEAGSLTSTIWWKKVLKVVALGFSVVALSSYPLAAAEDPPLSAVEITGTSETKGHLLAHTDRYWYVFDDKGTLLAIPDEDAKSVRIFRADYSNDQNN